MINQDHTQALIYFPSKEGITIDLSVLPTNLTLTWIDPRNGNRQPARLTETSRFIPPSGWEDAILKIG